MTTSNDRLKEWVAAGESETQEFKTTTGQRTDGAKTLCAMLNHRGGRVLFGVDPSGAANGQKVSDKTLEDVANELRHIEPPVRPVVDRMPAAGGLEVVVVCVQRGSRRPYTYKNKAYRRVGTTTSEMPRDEFNRMLLEQFHAVERWENRAAEEWAVGDLDEAEIIRTVEEAVRRGRLEDPGTRNPTDLLRGLGLMKDGQVLRAAVVLFAKTERLLPDFPQCLLRLARFKGGDKTEFADNRQYHGNAFDLLIRAERFLRDHLPVAGRVLPTLFEREDDPLYPPVALREALANAVCHRDYSVGGGSVAIAIFDDKLEISSSGTLHFGLKVEDLFKPHDSLPWNPIIASTFYKRGIIENWGRGTLKMAELTERAGLPRPDIEEAGGALLVRFRASRYQPPKRIGHDLSERQQEILTLLSEGSGLALRDVRQKLIRAGTERLVRKDLEMLKGLGLIDLKGHGRGAKWFLKAHA
jgi:ATP-dependent DNA helicase RecG